MDLMNRVEMCRILQTSKELFIEIKNPKAMYIIMQEKNECIKKIILLKYKKNSSEFLILLYNFSNFFSNRQNYAEIYSIMQKS